MNPETPLLPRMEHSQQNLSHLPPCPGDFFGISRTSRIRFSMMAICHKWAFRQLWQNFSSSVFILTHSVVLPKLPRDETLHRETLNILTVLFRQRNTSVLCCNGGPRGSDTQDKAERLMAATGHHTEVMMATSRQPNVADRVHDGRR